METRVYSLELVLQAIADNTRRAVIEKLSKGPASVSEIAKPFGLAMPSFMQHLRVLEKAGLVKTKKVGRIRTCRLDTKPLKVVENWLNEQRQIWESRLNQLDNYLLDLNRRNK